MGESRIVDDLGVSLNLRAFDGGLDRSSFKKRDRGGSGVGIGMGIKSSILSRSTNGSAVNSWMVGIHISGPESKQEDEREEKSSEAIQGSQKWIECRWPTKSMADIWPFIPA
jgi:hypothetical protein